MYLYTNNIFLFVTVTVIPFVIVTGLPQLGGGGGVLLERPPFSAGSTIDKETPEQSDLSGLIKFQFFIGREEGAGNGDFVKIHESNSTFRIPPGINRKCANDELIYEPDGKCYKTGTPVQESDSPCPDDFMSFANREEKPGYGTCYCAKFRGSTTVPVVFWPPSNRCYWLYDKGPCKNGEWLVFSYARDPDGELICSKRTCPENKVDPYNSFPKFWFELKGKCYQTETPNPEFCKDSGQKQIYFSLDKPEPICLDRRPVPFVRGLGSGVGNLGCRAGQKQLPNGSCKKKASFE